MDTKFKFNIYQFIFLAVGIAVGFFLSSMLLPPPDDCCDDKKTCSEELTAARDSLNRAYVISVDGPDRTAIDSLRAVSLINRFTHSRFARVDTFKGINLHMNHLAQMIQYHLDLGATSHGGFRIYNGLVAPSAGTDPTEADIRQIIVPVSTDGRVSMPSDNIWSFNPSDNFELPCPTLCD